MLFRSHEAVSVQAWGRLSRYHAVLTARSAILLAAWFSFSAGCSISGPAPQASFRAASPNDRMRAAVEAGTDRDASAVADLIDMLDAADPGARVVAVWALRRITGQNHGYDAAAHPGDRAEAAARWAQWYALADSNAEATGG